MIRLQIIFAAFLMVACAGQQRDSDTAETVSVEPLWMEEVEELIEHPLLEDAFKEIRQFDEQTVANQIYLNEIPAPPFMEEERAAAFAAMLQEYGLSDVETDEVGNVLARRPGRTGERTIVISAHLDTVFPEETDLTVEVRGDTLFAPGIVDDARGLTALLTLLHTMETAGIETDDDLLFAGTVGEEGLGDLRGVKHLFRPDGPEINAFISVDGSDDQQVTNQALGSHRYRVTVEGPGGHSWSAFGTANPAHALGRAIHHFDEAASDFVKKGPKTSYNVGRIGGGTSVNSVPYSNWMEVDMRSVDQGRLQELDNILHESVARAVAEINEMRQRGEPIRAELEMIGNRPSGEIAFSEPFIQRALAATIHFGGEPELVRSSTDSNVPISMGIPAMTLGGGGDGGQRHSLDEWWVNREGYKGIQRLLLIVLSEAGIAERVP